MTKAGDAAQPNVEREEDHETEMTSVMMPICQPLRGEETVLENGDEL